MLQPIETLRSHLEPSEALPIRQRLFRLICLTIVFLSFAVVLPANAFQSLPLLVNVGVVVLGTLGVVFYLEALRGRDHAALLLVALLVVLDVIWFLNGGSAGSLTYYFMPFMLYPIALFRGPGRWVTVVLLTANVCALFVVEHFWPFLTTPFVSPTARLVDLITGAFCSLVATALIAWVVVTGLDRERSRLAASEKDYRELVESARSVIIRFDRDGTIRFFNRFAEELFGYARSEVVGHPATETLFSTGGAEKVLPWGSMDRLLSHGAAEAARETEIRGRDGQTLQVEWSFQPIQDERGEIVEVLAVGSDVTGRKRAEEARYRLESRMRHVQRLESLGNLAGGIAHDFNNLLTGILGNLSQLRESTSPESEKLELLAEAQKASEQAKSLTSQLLTFAKGGKPVLTVVSLPPLVHDSAALALRGSAVACSIDAPHDLWSVEADAGQLGQVLNNLVLNAQQAMPDGGQVAITARNVTLHPSRSQPLEPGRYVHLAVGDQGTGIEESDLPRIFDPYFTTKASGTGLGLAVVHSIVRNHRGHIEVTSEVGEGTSVSILLPATDGPGPQVAVGRKEAAIGPKNVLVMDDNEFVRSTLVRMLARMGCRVESARDGAEALRLFEDAIAEARPFDVVIMDLTIPGGMGGLETFSRLEEISPGIRAIVSSGYSDDDAMASYAEHGFSGVLPKPYTLEKLQEVLRKVLEPAAEAD